MSEGGGGGFVKGMDTSLEGEAGGFGFNRGHGFGFLAGSLAAAVIAAASHASLSTLSSFRNVFSESFLDFFRDRSDRHQVAFGLCEEHFVAYNKRGSRE